MEKTKHLELKQVKKCVSVCAIRFGCLKSKWQLRMHTIERRQTDQKVRVTPHIPLFGCLYNVLIETRP